MPHEFFNSIGGKFAFAAVQRESAVIVKAALQRGELGQASFGTVLLMPGLNT